jgi:hypothetical protein
MPILEDMRKTQKEIASEKMFATYKGQRFELCYIGKTKWGCKALLYANPKRKFWVDADLVKIVK